LAAQFMQLADHLQLKATGTFAKKVCSEEALWSDITAQEIQFHGFGLSPDLLTPSGWMTLSQLFREFQQTQITVDSSACGHFEEAAAQKLICMLRSANQSTNRPKTFVGVMCFPRGSLPSSLDDHRRVQDAHTPAKPPSGIGDTFSLRLDLQDIPSGVTRPSVSENPAELTLHFGWQSNHLQMAVRNDGLPPGALEPVAWNQSYIPMLMGSQGCQKMITLDITACSSAMTLQYRSVPVIVNGPWTKCTTGLFVMRAKDTSVAIDALAMGVPCVVCDRMAKTT